MSHSRALSNIFDNNCWCFFLDQNIVILSIVTRTRWASILNIMIKWMFLNIMIKWMWQRLFFNDSQFQGFADHSCCSFLAQPSLPSQDLLVLQQHNQNKQRSLSCSVSIVFRLPISSCWSCPRLLACWPSLMGGACFHNIILSFLPSCETFYNGGDKQKRFSISETKRWLICVSITRSSSNILQPRQWWVVGCPTFPANATTAALQFYPMQPCSVLPKSYPPFPTGALTIPHQMCSVPHRRPTVSHQRPTFPYSSPLCSPPNV